MRKEREILNISNAKVEKLSKADQSKLKGGSYGMGFKEDGCPPPVGGFKEEEQK